MGHAVKREGNESEMSVPGGIVVTPLNEINYFGTRLKSCAKILNRHKKPLNFPLLFPPLLEFSNVWFGNVHIFRRKYKVYF
mgnify:CR=1 FL=1